MTTPTRQHFHVTALEDLLDEPIECPVLPTLAVTGHAQSLTGQHYVVLELTGAAAVDRFYLGPTQDLVERRAQIVTHALEHGCSEISAEQAAAVGAWLLLAWDVMLEELTVVFSPWRGGSTG